MTKSDLIETISVKAGVSKKSAAAMIDALTSTIVEAAHDGEQVSIHGFGTFTRKDRKARSGHNPRTGGKVDVPASSTLGFKPVPSLKAKLS